MAERKIVGAVQMGNQVYRAGQEKELEAAAKAEGVSLSDAQFADAFEGGETVTYTSTPSPDAEDGPPEAGEKEQGNAAVREADEGGSSKSSSKGKK